ncbi:MAG: DUF4178 domain-containing protein, partial [Chloroflexota bacterium]
DRTLRAHIADRLQEERRQMENLETAMAEANALRDLPPIEAAVVRLRTLADEIRTASYGYAGWFDTATVEEKELDALYEHDSRLAEGVDWIDHHVKRLAGPVDRQDERAIRLVLDDLDATIDRLAEQVVRRREVVLEAKRPPALSPRRLLAAAQGIRKSAPRVPNLQPGDAVSYEGTDYLVGGRVDYRHGTSEWQAYLLEDSEERWLWVVDDGRGAYFLAPVPLPEDMTDKTSISWDEETLTLVEAGMAEADVEGASGRQSVEKWGDEVTAYLGDPVRLGELETWQRPRGR